MSWRSPPWALGRRKAAKAAVLLPEAGLVLVPARGRGPPGGPHAGGGDGEELGRARDLPAAEVAAARAAPHVRREPAALAADEARHLHDLRPRDAALRLRE